LTEKKENGLSGRAKDETGSRKPKAEAQGTKGFKRVKNHFFRFFKHKIYSLTLLTRQ